MPQQATRSDTLYLVCGLGNPGTKFARNRHNAGFHCLDLLAEKWGLSFGRMRSKALVAMGHIAESRVVLAKPMTYMNSSGHALSPLMSYYKIPLRNLLVVYDELDLPLGKIRLRADGGPGGHNGMRSIIQQLGTRDFSRLRIGIGRPEHGEPYRYVLSDFYDDQRPDMEAAYERGAEAIQHFLEHGIRSAMNEYNG
jgi:PTH1 family peptidyl-tRNA hydrolase